MPTYAEIREAFKNAAPWLLTQPSIVGHYIAEGPLGVIMLKEELPENQKQQIIDRLGLNGGIIFENSGPIEAQGRMTPQGLTHGPAGDIALP